MAKTKLELTWIGKDTRPKLEPRILLEDTSKSHHASQRVTENDFFDNRLIFGDNSSATAAYVTCHALKVLEPVKRPHCHLSAMASLAWW